MKVLGWQSVNMYAFFMTEIQTFIASHKGMLSPGPRIAGDGNKFMLMRKPSCFSGQLSSLSMVFFSSVNIIRTVEISGLVELPYGQFLLIFSFS